MKKQKETILIVDGDVLAFRAAAAAMTTRVKSVKITHKKSGKCKIYKNEEVFKEFLKSKNVKFKESDYEIEEQTHKNITELKAELALEGIEYKKGELEVETVIRSAPKSVPCKVMDQQLANMQEYTFASKIVMFVSGENNFRDDLALPEKYKSNREDAIRPPTLNECKEHLVINHKGTRSHGMETDDMVIIAARHYQKKGYDVVIATNDKDAFAYDGISIYVFTDKESDLVYIENPGELHFDKSGKVKGSGFKWLCFQLIQGDDTDNFKPCQIAGVRFGEKSAYNILNELTTEQECFDAVCRQYKKWYPDVHEYEDWRGDSWMVKWKDVLQLYWYCAKMKETMKDDLNIDTFIESKGLVWNVEE